MSGSTDEFGRIRPNPGGALEPAHVLGRDELIDDLWRTLASQSVALLAPRRMGKTSVLARMAAEPPPGFIVVRRDLEGLDSPEEFTQVLLADVEGLLSGWKLRANRARAQLASLAIDTAAIKAELRGIGWKRLLDNLFADLQDAFDSRRDEAGQEQRLVLMWDEVTLFVDDLLRRKRADDAIAFLDTLRAARQRHPKLRMILTGSIGFDEVLGRLRTEHGYRNRPLNDVARTLVPLLDRSGSEALARALLRSGARDDTPGLVEAVVTGCEGHPFVIQLVADRLLRLPAPRVADVGLCLRALLRPPGDPLDLLHWVDRLETQFGPQATVARTLLDRIAVSASGLPRAKLIAGMPEHDPELVREVLRRLEDEFYLRRLHEPGDGSGGSRVVFMLGLLREFWREERGCA